MSHFETSITVSGARLRRVDLRMGCQGVLNDLPVYCGASIFCIFSMSFLSFEPGNWVRDFAATLTYFVIAWLFSSLLFRVGDYVLYLRPERPALQLAKDTIHAARSGALQRWLPLLAMTALFGVFFTRLKIEIPELTGGFHWDETFFVLDKSLHFGFSPYQLLQPVLGYPFITFILVLNYNIWFFVMWGVFFSFAARPAGGTGRTRYMVSFFLVWGIAGGVLAWAFSSAGPCFYAFVVPGENPYAPLMEYLRSADRVVPIWALQKQELLWSQYAEGRSQFGISAMPSIHNAMACLSVLGARDLAPRLRPWLIAHMALVFVGSIHLGWHYAVDAYAAFAVTAAIWFAVTPFARRWDARFASA